MENVLKDHFRRNHSLEDEWINFRYRENVNKDALSEDWLKSRTSYIYKVGVLCAIDANKCDWAYAVIGTQRSENSPVQIIGTLHFEEGENDDMGWVMKRVNHLLAYIHPAFEDAI